MEREKSMEREKALRLYDRVVILQPGRVSVKVETRILITKLSHSVPARE